MDFFKCCTSGRRPEGESGQRPKVPLDAGAVAFLPKAAKTDASDGAPSQDALKTSLPFSRIDAFSHASGERHDKDSPFAASPKNLKRDYLRGRGELPPRAGRSSSFGVAALDADTPPITAKASSDSSRITPWVSAAEEASVPDAIPPAGVPLDKRQSPEKRELVSLNELSAMRDDAARSARVARLTATSSFLYVSEAKRSEERAYDNASAPLSGPAETFVRGPPTEEEGDVSFEDGTVVFYA
jgi:hypothetical protein